MDNLTTALAGVSKGVATVAPEGTSFDGSTDYLSATSLTGNIDSKTFTFSCWVYRATAGTQSMLFEIRNGATRKFDLQINSNGTIQLVGFNSAGSSVLNISSTVGAIKARTWANIIVSIDLTDTGKRHLYIADIDATPSFATYTNDLIDFDGGVTYQTCRENTNINFDGRLSNLFLDYTYRDLSIEANRRLFIDADGKPADPSSLSPILYLPMTDAATCHQNSGTGGDFVQNGTLATADRGANQDNCVASEFDGVDDYLSSTGISASDSKVLTFNCVFKGNELPANQIISFSDGAGQPKLSIVSESGNIDLLGWNTANTIIFFARINNVVFVGRDLAITVSVDLANVANRAVFVNGVAPSVTWTTYTNDLIDYTYASPRYRIGTDRADSPTSWVDGSLGELYFDTTYIDLATSNPFWDSDTNKPIPVRTAMTNLGSNPLICMPISADNPTKNYGSGGDFTLNGGGLVGAMGASEHIARGCVVDATNYLTGSIVCASLVKWLSIDGGVTWTPTYANSVTVTNIGNGTDNGVVAYYFGFSDTINWADEANKNLVTNQLGFPRNPTDVINESGWTPVLGLFFEDTTNFGLNSYGADYTTTGTITAGADVNI